MGWIDIVCIIFVCVTANHLGLIGKLEEICGKLPIIDCPKCLTFWVTLFYCFYNIASYRAIFLVLAISFFASYSAIWLELLEGYIDTLYLKLYGKIITADTHDTSASDAERGDSTDSVP